MWKLIQQQKPPEGKVLKTKIDDGHRCRNVQELKRKGNLWFYPDMSMYVYYTPTHWFDDSVTKQVNKFHNSEK